MRQYDYFDLDQLLLNEPEKYWTYEDILVTIPSAGFKRGDKIKTNEYFTKVEGAKRKIERILRKSGLHFDYKNGKDAKQGFRYPQGVKDPIHYAKEEIHKLRTKQLLRLLSASINLFPQTWLADIVEGAQFLAADDKKLISFDQNMHVEHLQWVPTIFDAIEKKKVLSFQYRPRYEEKVKEVLLHPYFLKEFNSRWFVFGHATYTDGKVLEQFNCALDRIEGEISIVDDIEYIGPKGDLYAEDYFKDIVGVTRHNKPRLTIKIETRDAYTHWRIMTKKLHQSQRKLRDFSKTQTGLFSIDVIPNNELDTLLLGFGAHIRIIEPQSYLDSFQEMVRKLADLYPPKTKSDGKEDVKS